MLKLYTLRILTILIPCLVFTGSLSAQAPYSLIPGNSISATTDANGFTEPKIEALNNTSDNIYLEYEVLSNTLDTAWSILFCYRGGCFPRVTQSAAMDSIRGGAQAMIFKLTLDPQGVAGTGTLVLRLWERSNPSVADTITMDVEITPNVSVAEELAAQIKVFPQPVQDFLYVDMPASLGKVELDIVDLSGVLVYRDNVNATDAKLDVSSLAQGMYILRIKNDKMILNKRILVD